jgi:preprotein translocase subunit Sss1
MKENQQDVKKSLKAIDDVCLKCKKHSDSCYVAVAKRSILILNSKQRKTS